MSGMTGNPYESEANMYAVESSLRASWDEQERMILATQAAANASLVLAYEQRTANLIALSEALIGNPGFEETRNATFDVIYERLGLLQPTREAKS